MVSNIQEVILMCDNASLARSEDAVHCMEAVGWGDLAAVVARNLSITRSLRAVDALLLVLRVQEVQNFEWWECLVAEEVPAQDQVEEEPQQDCFRMLVVQ